MLDPLLLKSLEKHTLTCQGQERTFWVIPPAGGTPPSSGFPIVLMLHGGGSRGEYMQALTKGRLQQIAERDGFLLVYPQAYKSQWNDGRNAASLPAYLEGIDDVRFLTTLIQWLKEHARGDSNQVFLGGISNGGMMSCRFAYEAPGQAKGIAMVAAGMPVDLVSQKTTAGPPVGVMLIHGTADPWVPYAGGVVNIGSGAHGNVLPVQETLRYWAKHNAGPGGDFRLREAVLADATGTGGTQIIRTSIEGLPPAGPVVLYTVEGGGHTWPGGWQYFTESIIGKTSRELDASETILAFFRSL